MIKVVKNTGNQALSQVKIKQPVKVVNLPGTGEGSAGQVCCYILNCPKT